VPAKRFKDALDSTFELRPYQSSLAAQGCEILKRLGLVYYAMQVRTGKSHTSMECARLFGAKKVLFVTKKKAISSIQSDYETGQYPFEIEVINSESIHKVVMVNPDLVILDEAHQFGALGKPTNRTKEMQKRYGNLPIIYLSGTPTPENGSQIFNQLWISARSPFRQYTSFFKWAQEFVNVYQRNMGYATVNMYDRARQEKIDPFIKPYMLTFTQEEAGFESEVIEHILEVEMSQKTYDLIETLKSDLFIEGRGGVTITADSAVKLMSKIHQLGSGTVKADDEKGYTIDKTKAEFIKNRFAGIKIGVFYKFKEEWEMLKSVFGDNVCNTLDEFNGSDKNIALQIQAGREGISLKEAKYLVYLNIDFSATSYWQSRARTQTMDRLNTEIFWVFSARTSDKQIYKKVMSKKNYTSRHFLKEVGVDPSRFKKTEEEPED